MEAVKVRKIINSKDLHIDELEKYIGQEADIIIIPLAPEKRTNKKNLVKLAGAIKTGESPLKFQKNMRK